MAYSSGFSPHPRISYATAAPTSAASEAEYVELGLSERCDPAKVLVALNESMPTGFVILDAADAVGVSLGDLLQASEWEIRLDGADAELLERAVDGFLGEESIVVERMTKNGMREFEARQAVLDLRVEASCIRVLLRHGVPLVRPDDVVTGLRQLEPDVPSRPLLTRLSQGVLEVDRIVDPLRPE